MKSLHLGSTTLFKLHRKFFGFTCVAQSAIVTNDSSISSFIARLFARRSNTSIAAIALAPGLLLTQLTAIAATDAPDQGHQQPAGDSAGPCSGTIAISSYLCISGDFNASIPEPGDLEIGQTNSDKISQSELGKILVIGSSGINLSYKDQNGSSTSQVTGELRFLLDNLVKPPNISAVDNSHAFFYLDANINSNEKPSAPTTGDWDSFGIGIKATSVINANNILDAKLKSDGVHGWNQFKAKIGVLDNRIEIDTGKYWTGTVVDSIYSPFFANSKVLPFIVSGTAGSQIQKPIDTITGSIPTQFSWIRIDAYAQLNFISQNAIVHIERQNSNHSYGFFSSLDLSYKLNSFASLSITRKVGRVDPISDFAVPIQNANTTQIAIKFTNSGAS